MLEALVLPVLPESLVWLESEQPGSVTAALMVTLATPAMLAVAVLQVSLECQV